MLEFKMKNIVKVVYPNSPWNIRLAAGSTEIVSTHESCISLVKQLIIWMSNRVSYHLPNVLAIWKWWERNIFNLPVSSLLEAMNIFPHHCRHVLLHVCCSEIQEHDKCWKDIMWENCFLNDFPTDWVCTNSHDEHNLFAQFFQERVLMAGIIGIQVFLCSLLLGGLEGVTAAWGVPSIRS